MGLPLLQPVRVRSPEAVAAIAGLRPDLGVLADYGQIIPPALLAIPPHGILNVHPSALPRHRGASPIAATIAAGDAARDGDPHPDGRGARQRARSSPASRGRSIGTETAPDLEAEAARRGAALLVGDHRRLAGRPPRRRCRRPTIGRQPDAAPPARGRTPGSDSRRSGAGAPGSRLPAVARAASSRPARDG